MQLRADFCGAQNRHYVHPPHLTLKSPRPAPTNSPKPAKTPHYHPLIRRFSTLQHEPLIGRSDAVIRRKSAGHPETAKASKLRALVKPPNVRRLMAAFGRWPTSAARQWGAQPPSGSPPGRRERAKGARPPTAHCGGSPPRCVRLVKLAATQRGASLWPNLTHAF